MALQARDLLVSALCVPFSSQAVKTIEPVPPLSLEELVNHEAKPHDFALFCCDS